MTIGVTLNDKHCYDDYGMWLVNVDISQPEVQTHYVQVPGRTGELDLTEALTGDVRYYNGSLSMTFQTTEKVCGHSWLDQLQRIKADLHGIKAEAVFDDSNILYKGRCEVSGTPVAGGIFEITVDMNVESAEEPIYDHYFAVYCATDGSLTFYGADELPSGTYRGKTVTTVYDGADSTGTSTSSVPWYSDRANFKSVQIHVSFAGARPTRLYYYFSGFTNCTEIEGLSHLNTENVTDMRYMFRGCSALGGRLDLSSFNTANVTNMTYMFSQCTGLTKIDISMLDTAKVTSMGNMFYNCSNLTTIYSNDDKFVTTAVTSGGSMFYNCTKLVGGNGTTYDSSKVDSTMAHVDTASNPGYFTGK